MYVSFLTFVLGYGQLLALDESLTACPARCELIFCNCYFVLLGEINDDDDDDIDVF